MFSDNKYEKIQLDNLQKKKKVIHNRENYEFEKKKYKHKII